MYIDIFFLHIYIWISTYGYLLMDIYILDIYKPRYLRMNIDILCRYLCISNSFLDIHLAFLMPLATAL